MLTRLVENYIFLWLVYLLAALFMVSLFILAFSWDNSQLEVYIERALVIGTLFGACAVLEAHYAWVRLKED